MFAVDFGGFRMVILDLRRVWVACWVPQPGLRVGTSRDSSRAVNSWRRGQLPVLGLIMRFCWPSLHALRAETMVDGLPRAFRLKFPNVFRFPIFSGTWLVEMVTIQAILFSNRRQTRLNVRTENRYASGWLFVIISGCGTPNWMSARQNTQTDTADRMVRTRGSG